jgi:hypothetical protein
MKKYKPYLKRVDLVKNQVERERIQEQEAAKKRKQRIQEQNRQRHLRYQEQLRSELAARYFHGVVSAGGESNIFTNTKSLNFDGNDDFVDCGTATNLNFSADDPFSVSVWFKKPSESSSRALIGKSLNGTFNGAGWLFWTNGNLVHFRIRENSSNFHQIRDNSTHPLNVWVHYVVTYDGSRTGSGLGLNLYKNGNKLTNVAKSGNFSSGTGQSSANLVIGARRTQQPGQLVTDLFHRGNIDDPAVFNSELSLPDVQSIYNNGVPNDISSLSPIGWWQFEGTGATVTDSGTGGNDGTINGATRDTDVPS